MTYTNRQERKQQLQQHITLQGKFPSITSSNKEERDLARFVNSRRTKTFLTKPTNQEEIGQLVRMHPGLFSKRKIFDITQHPPPPQWQEYFDTFEAKTNIDHIQQFTNPSTNNPWTLNATSFEQYILLRTNALQHIYPEDCFANTQLGSMQNVLSYALNDRLDMPTVEYQQNIHPRQLSSTPGSYYEPCNNTPELNNALNIAQQNLFPNDLLQHLRECEDDVQVQDLLYNNINLFDAFHIPYGGRPDNIVNIMDTTYQQPRRTNYSCTFGPTVQFPLLDIPVRRLYSYYHGHGRAAADDRARPMPPWLYTLGIETWKHVNHSLPSMCRIMPHYHCQILLYVETRKKHGTKNQRVSGYMGLHHDSGAFKNDNDNWSHIRGTSVTTTTLGDEMVYRLVSPDTRSNQTIQSMTLKEAQQNSTKPHLRKDIVLGDRSTYVHTAEDDASYVHGAHFEPYNSSIHTPTRVRCVLAWRYLGNHQFYRAKHDEDSRIKYSMVSKHGFDQFKQLNTGPKWAKALGYEINRNSTVPSLLK